MDVQNSLKVMADVSNIAVDAITLVKKGFNFGSFGAIIDMLLQGKNLMVDAPLAWPELKDIDPQEAAQLGAAAYDMTAKIILALKS